ncbi:RxLR effector protein [Phytophthora megakarya]|uniref:RxLR effector protein n=1 Tax=Phytophthora megakarya TaxID=4795 RepID=A0A225V5D5_9STRA|nr:RxLR effector protein [Phytophthora megakarya]
MRLGVAVLATIVITTNYAATNAELSPISSTTTSTLTEGVSVIAAPDLARSLKTDNGAGIERRFLRNHREVGDEADVVDDGIEADDEEERKGGANLFAEGKLTQMKNSVKTFKRFANWKAYGLSPTDVYTRMVNKGIYDKYKDVYSMYNRNYATI